MSTDKTPFKAPERYPEPPQDMWYEVPKARTYQQPAPIFPWEENAPKPTRVFAEDEPVPIINKPVSTEDEPEIPASPTTPTMHLTPADPWQSFSNTRGNAWDDIPEIEKYIGALQKNRKGNIQVLQGYGSGISPVASPGARGPSLKLTDFPTELERPSLPVTPAPIRRPTFWGNERDEEGELPAAEGVPAQADWVCPNCGLPCPFCTTNRRKDPAAQLEVLAARQSVMLANKLGTAEAREIPTRPLPYGSEGVRSPTFAPLLPPKEPTSSRSSTGGYATRSTTGSSITIEEPSFKGPGAMFEKDETYPTYETPMPPSEEEKDVLEN